MSVVKKHSAYKTISEVAELAEVQQHVLRFWEKKFLCIKPLKSNNRRYYDEKTIDSIFKIKKMLYEDGYTIKGAIKEINKHNINTDPIKSLEQILLKLKTIRNNLS